MPVVRCTPIGQIRPTVMYPARPRANARREPPMTILTVIIVSFCFGVLGGLLAKEYMDKQDRIAEENKR